MSKWLYSVGVIAFGFLTLWCWHLGGELDEHKAMVAVLKQDAVVLKSSLNGLAAWSAETDKVLEAHRLAAKKQESAFRKLQSQVRAAYEDKEAADWGRTRVPDALRVLLGGKPTSTGD